MKLPANDDHRHTARTPEEYWETVEKKRCFVVNTRSQNKTLHKAGRTYESCAHARMALEDFLMFADEADVKKYERKYKVKFPRCGHCFSRWVWVRTR